MNIFQFDIIPHTFHLLKGCLSYKVFSWIWNSVQFSNNLSFVFETNIEEPFVNYNTLFDGYEHAERAMRSLVVIDEDVEENGDSKV